MKKISSLLIVLVSWVTYSFAQSITPQVIASNGTFASAGGYTLSYTTGQPVSSTLTTTSSIITQGFQQPNDIYTGVQTFATPALTAQLYPNPAIDQINLVITSSNNNGTYTVQLVDLLGRVLQQPLTTEVSNGQTRFVFNVQNLPSSMYFITVKSSGSDVMHSFKFNKIN
jgi:hypothetical protein